MSRKPPKRTGKSTPVLSEDEQEEEVTLERIFAKVNMLNGVKEDIAGLKSYVNSLLGIKKDLTDLTNRVEAQSLDLEGAKSEVKRIDQNTKDIKKENIDLKARVDRLMWQMKQMKLEAESSKVR